MTIIITIALIILFLATISAAIYFIADKALLYSKDIYPYKSLSKRLIFWFYLILCLASIILTGALINVEGKFYDILFAIVSVLFGTFVISFFVILIVEIIRLFTKWRLRTYGIIAKFGTLAIVSFSIINAYSPKIVEKTIKIPDLKQELTYVQLTDIHLGHIRGPKYLEKVVKKINTINADGVFITGDVFDGHEKVNYDMIKPLENIKAPIYSITGNHDNYAGIKNVDSLILMTGAKLLNNQIINLKYDKGDIQLIGLYFMIADKKAYDIHSINKTITMRSELNRLSPDQDIPTILLNHSPYGVKYANEHGVDLFICGHTHGGQMFPLTLINILAFPYNRGLYTYKGTKKDTKVYVSDGIGTFGPPMRLGTNAEITLLHLIPSK